MESYFHPEGDHQSVEYPQGVISIQRTKASGLGPRVPLFITTPNSARCASFFSWYFGLPTL